MSRKISARPSAMAERFQVKAAGGGEIVPEEVKFTLDQDLTVRTQDNRDLAVEDELGGVLGINLPGSLDDHGLGECGEEAVHARVVLDRHILVEDLAFDGLQPSISIQ